MTNIIVVGDENLSLLMEYAPVSWEISRTDNVAGLVEGRRSGSLPKTPDAVVFTDLTGDTLKDVMNAAGSMLMSRVPVAVLAYNTDTIAKLQGSYPALEESIARKHAEMLERKRENGQEISASERENPLANTEFILSPASNGIGGVIQELGPALRNPLQVGELSDKYFKPLPHPVARTSSAQKATPASRQGQVITMVSDKGGCGKTSTSLLLGSALAYHTFQSDDPKTVCVVDLDRQSQMRGHYPTVREDITLLRANSTADEVKSALHAIPEVGNLYVLLGGKNTNEHLAMRTADLYDNVVKQLRSMFDVVILDASVGTNSDAVTKWAQQSSDTVFYVLDHSSESVHLAVDAHADALRSIEDGGLGLSEDTWQVVINRARETSPSFEAFMVEVDKQIGMKKVASVLPNSDPEVSDAKDEGRLVQLVQTSPVLAHPLYVLAKRIFPNIVDTTVNAETSEPRKKRFFGKG